ncbi:hypothetical protein HMN09_01332300 [Mycena chlorophos]|uniref:Uncharacterized protein n=1 Tax=Mycena chlorophos TaxID=658473 RepID=A0A8H6S0K3_MYCCL|nr:hypothetical protein HMN09_01332300 [Mycena chlorophos]
MKKLAARDFEDILQCSMPVFEHLLDNNDYAADNEMIQDLLFAHAYWHGLAKLRMHTTFTLECLKEATRDLGYQLRRFARTTCKTFVTKELPREEAARRKRYTRKVAEAGRTGAAPPPETSASTKVKTFNGNTIKTHFLGDYVPTIPLIGTSDSWSTATGELEHKRSKAFYGRTSKNQATTQISNLERREAALAKIGDRVRAAAQAEDVGPVVGEKRKRPAARGGPSKQGATLSFAQTEALPYTAPEEHVHVSFSRNVHVPLDVWIRQHMGDPAFNNFRVKLDCHLLARILHPEYSTDGSEYTTSDRNHISIVNDRIYIHKVIRVNYTDYTVRRGQDSMNPRTHADVMTLAPEGADGHPCSYYRIVGVWHCDVQYREFGYLTPKKTICLLYARRFRLDKTFKGGFKRRRLHRIELVPERDDDAYTFLNPDEIIRESHVVPAYAHGALPRVFHETIGRKAGEFNDWKYYYVNFFVDRDMLMRYLGGGVGHSYRVIVPDPPQELAGEPEDESEDEPAEIDPAAAHLVPDVPGPDVDLASEDGSDGESDKGGDEDGPGSEDDDWSESESESESDDDPEAAAAEDDGDEGFYLGPEDGEDGLDDGLQDLAQLLFLTAGVVLVDDDGTSVYMSAGLQYGGTNAQGGPYYTPTLLLQDLPSTQFTQISYGNYPVNPGDTLQISATLDNIVPMPGINWYELEISSPTNSQLDISYLARVNASTPVIAMFRVQEEGVNPGAGEYPTGDVVFEDVSVNSTTGVAGVEWMTRPNATLGSGITVEVQSDDAQIMFVFPHSN